MTRHAREKVELQEKESWPRKLSKKLDWSMAGQTRWPATLSHASHKSFATEFGAEEGGGGGGHAGFRVLRLEGTAPTWTYLLKFHRSHLGTHNDGQVAMVLDSRGGGGKGPTSCQRDSFCNISTCWGPACQGRVQCTQTTGPMLPPPPLCYPSRSDATVGPCSCMCRKASLSQVCG